MESTNRETILKEMIDRYPGISTTSLQNRVRKVMAKDTASKMLEDLVNDHKIIRRKEGKAIRYFPLDAEEERLNKDLAAALDGYVKDLCAMKEEMTTYPYDLLNAFNNEIPRQRDSLARLKSKLEGELKFEHAVEDLMRDYSEMHGYISKLLWTHQRIVDDDTRLKVQKCMWNMSVHLKQKATRQLELRKQRTSYGKSEKRDSLTKEIDQLDLDINKILERAADLQFKLQYIKENKPNELWGPFAPQPVDWLQRIEESRMNCQRLIERALEAKTSMQEDDLEHWQGAEAGLNRVREQLSDIKRGLVETEDAVIKSYIGADLHKHQKELSLLVEEILETYRP